MLVKGAGVRCVTVPQSSLPSYLIAAMMVLPSASRVRSCSFGPNMLQGRRFAESITVPLYRKTKSWPGVVRKETMENWSCLPPCHFGLETFRQQTIAVWTIAPLGSRTAPDV